MTNDKYEKMWKHMKKALCKCYLEKNNETATIRKKAMISLNGLTDEEIEKTRNKAIKHLERLGYKVVNPLTDKQKTFLEGMNQTEIVLDSYFDMIIDT